MGNKNDLLLSSLSALDVQVGGDHYKEFKIQPVEFCFRNNIPYLEATAIKYLCRWRNKGGIQDLQKAKHFIDILIQMETLYANKLDDDAEPLQMGLNLSDGDW